jgi:hypothetical protein
MGLFNFEPAWMKDREDGKFLLKTQAEIERMADISTLMKIVRTSPCWLFRRAAIFRLDKLENKIDVETRLEFFKSVLENDSNENIKEIVRIRIRHIEDTSTHDTLLRKYGHYSELELVQLYKSASENEKSDIQRMRWEKTIITCSEIAKNRQGKVIHEQHWESGAGKTYTYQANIQIYCDHCNEITQHDLEYTASYNNGGFLSNLAYGGIKTTCKKCNDVHSVPCRKGVVVI